MGVNEYPSGEVISDRFCRLLFFILSSILDLLQFLHISLLLSACLHSGFHECFGGYPFLPPPSIDQNASEGSDNIASRSSFMQ